MSGVEALAQALPLPGCNCEAHYSEGGSRLCKAWRERDRLRQARDILADPGPLLEALAEAGILHRHSAPLKRRAAGGWAMVYGGDHTVEGTRYATEWEVDDDRG